MTIMKINSFKIFDTW